MRNEALEGPMRKMGSKSALLIIDMQNCFFEKESLAAVREPLVASCNRLIARAFRAGSPVVNVRTEHRRDQSTWTLNMLADDQGFAFVGEPSACCLPELQVAGAMELVKTRDSAFFHTDLGPRLRNMAIDRLVLCGISAHGCVAATAADAYAHNVDAVLVEDAIASHLPGRRQVLALLGHEYRQRVVPAEEVVFFD